MSSSTMLLQIGGRQTPYIQQNEASECALACLAMVASYHGYETDLSSLRQRFGLSLKGATLKTIVQIAENLGFNARPLRGELDDLVHLSLPAILHWNLNHFVVLTKISSGLRRTRYHIHDPARGVLILERETISRHFTGVAVDLLKSESFKPKIDRRELRITQLWSSMSGFWLTIRQILLLSIVLQCVVLATPFFLQISIDTVFPSFDLDLLLILALGFTGLAIINYMAAWLRAHILVALSNSLAYQVIVNLFRHLVRLPLDWFEKRHVGDVVSRFGSTAPISQLLSQGMIASFIDGTMAITTFVLMLLYSTPLAFVTLLAIAVYTLIRFGFLEALKLQNIDAITSAAVENSVFIETVRGIAALKAFGQESNRQQQWQRTKARAINANIKLGRLTANFDTLGQFILALEQVLFVYIAISLAINATITIGMLFAFQSYRSQFVAVCMRLIEQAINWKVIQVHLSRISDIALSETENPNESLSQEKPDFAQPITLNNIHFKYGVGEAEVLRGLNLQIQPGEMVALIGPSGGGKTTLVKIILGLLTPTHGDILIAGRTASSFSRNSYRRAIGSVAQDDTLFAGTIAENIAFFDPEIDMDRVERVCRMACIWDEISKLPMRLDTMVGDMGSVFSGGQKQRIFLARALYPEPKLLIMDEGTAHLDPASEAAVIQTLNSLNITRILVAHRPLSVQAADHVWLVSKGIATPIPKDLVPELLHGKK